tara:strand:- start:44984 stop:48424 length:3441 start_codon:yes stop_codon:yes gene_type:complete
MTNIDRARSLFEAALALPEADRHGYLAKQCIDDPELEQLVLRLLSQASMATAESPIRSKHTVSLAPGARVGSYTIISPIGEGGMGVVYRALQLHPEREVALKLIQPGALSERMLRRFELETEVLGRLKHPGIAQIYDAGTQQGPAGAQPYFAMELVDGLPLNEYIFKKKLDTRGRLDLMAKICDAVEHAHQKGVIHRDLKPANILVSADGQPKILDFGVARATESDLQSVTMQTDIGQLVGTIPYMSPEQVLGDPAQLDTRSDVYGLGVVLYELLSGQLPYQLPEHMIHEAVRVIREVDPTRLSSLNTRLGGDVEIITGKALEKDKDRRYQSASGLASDIRHYLADEPIVARPASRSYQIRKFARRNRVLVGGVAATVLVLLLGLIGTTYGLVQAEAQRAEAVASQHAAELAQQAEAEARVETERRAQELQLVADFQSEQLAGFDADAMGLSLRHGLGEKLVALGERRGFDEAQAETMQAEYESLVSGADFTGLALDALDEHIFTPSLEAIETQFADQPLVEARLLATLGRTMRDAGLLQQATRPFANALQIRRHELGDDHPDTLTSIGNMGSLFQDQGMFTEAESFCRKALEGRRRVLGNDHQDTLISINRMGLLLRSLGRLNEAVTYSREAMVGNQRVLGDDHPSTLASINNMGLLLSSQGKLAEAEFYYRKALEGSRRVLGNDHPSTITYINNIGIFYQSQGKLADAQPYLREAMEGNRRVLGDDHPNTMGSINNMGLLLSSQGKLAEAEPYYSEALEGYRRVLGTAHPDTLSSINNMGTLLFWQGKLAEAQPYLREALEGRRRVLGDDHPDTLASINNMGLLLSSQGKLAEAEPYYSEALEGSRRVLGDDHPDTLVSLTNMGGLLQSQGKLSEAEPYYREALEGMRRVLGDDHTSTLTLINNMGSLLQSQGKLAEAEPFLREALEGRRRVFGEDHAGTLTSINNMGSLLQSQGKLAEAEPYYREALEGLRRLLGDDHPNTLMSRRNMAALLEKLKRWPEAEEFRRLSVEITRRAEPEGGAQLASTLVMLGMNLIEQDQPGKAEPVLRECFEIRKREMPEGHWLIWNTQSLLGETLASQSKFTEAEGLLVEAAEQIQPPEQAHDRLDEAIQRVVELYTAWHEAEPEGGYDAKAAEWQAKLNEE